MKTKNVTVVITMDIFGIETDKDENEAVLQALAKDIMGWRIPMTADGIIDYFTDPTITITATDS